MKKLRQATPHLKRASVALLVLLVFATTGFAQADTEKPAPGPRAEAINSAQTWLRDVVPGWLKDTLFMLEHWQWIGLFILIALALIVDRVVAFLVKGLINRLLEVKRLHALGELPESLWKKAERPFGLIAGAGLVLGALSWIGLPLNVENVFSTASMIVLSGAVVWASYRFVDLLSIYFLNLAEGTDTKLDDMLVPLVRKILKVFMLAIGIVFVLQNLNVEVGSLLAGLGIGGLAFALAAKDTVANIFGSITVLLDQPFQVGDWIVTAGVEGTVERVGFRSTRIRTFYNSLITLPNSKLIDSAVDNYGARRFRRYKSRFGIAYDTPPWKIEAYCEGIRELVRLHPYTRKDYFHVYFNDLGESSLQIMIYIFHQCPDWGTELRERHRFLVDSLKIAARLGVEYAFPTRTVHIPGLENLPGMEGKTPVAKRKVAIDEVEEEGIPEEPPTIRRTLVLGRKIARKVVAETLKPDEIPAPVNFDHPDFADDEAVADAVEAEQMRGERVGQDGSSDAGQDGDGDGGGG